MSNLKDKRKNLHKLEPGYEARARRIASVYAKIYLEKEKHGNKDLIGRYYWMGLGAFASKTVAAIFKHGLTAWGYKWIPLGVIRDPVHTFAKGNLWLFMDIAPWHYAWSMSSQSFNQCRTQRDVSKFTHIKEEVLNIPWSSCLPIIKHLQSTTEITQAFWKLPKIESVLKRKGFSRSENFKDAEKDLMKHLLAIAVQEQRNILQELVWKDWKVQAQATLQSYTKLPDSTLILSSDYGVDAVKPDKHGSYKDRHAGVLDKLPESVYSEPLAHTKVQDYDSRMEWIQKAAEKYHTLMLSDTGRPFLEKELAIIAGWGNSKADFIVGKDSNDGKI
ncbi:hypothetical protein G0027_10860 [Acinetobacter indicus]|uniref:Uncharacterized protein n=1 Tax=Acinetobacter indicus TaxID=756892 RepID=A0A7S6VSQ7_9GAMM|nr:hypothetical protein G0027_10860 [Acinetobacter indicus]RVT32686.1 hypothetical protein ENC20_10785 [Acinetobacter indicus]